jgi:hypothetical protein
MSAPAENAISDETCYGRSETWRGGAGREPAVAATTATKSLLQPTRYKSAGRAWPGISAVSGPPGLRAASS